MPPTVQVTAHAAKATKICLANLKLTMFIPHEARSRAYFKLIIKLFIAEGDHQLPIRNSILCPLIAIKCLCGYFVTARHQITFCARRALISSCPNPSSANTSSVCSPKSGERFTSVGLSLILMGLPTLKYLPRLGWSTSTTVPVARSDGSLANSSIERIGPHGISCWLSSSMASNLVLVTVHCSTAENTSLSRGSRASGVAKFGSVIHSSLPITLQMAFHTGAWAMK